MNSKRIRDFGITVGRLPCGEKNKITDVPGVKVGQVTIDTDKSKTGVTVIIPADGNLHTHPIMAACHVINGFGKTAGLMQVEELGTLETPIALTGTLNVGKVHNALVSYTVAQCEGEGGFARSVNPIVGETNDGTLSYGAVRPTDEAEVLEAIKNASDDFAEGDVGAGKGTVCFGLKGGIGSASRVIEIDDKKYTLGALVQTNFGCIEDLSIDGLKVGAEVVKMMEEEKAKAITGQDDIGSIMIVIGTDLPVSELQLKRILKRATVGLARTGSYIGHGSGDVVIGFSTANRRGGDEKIRTVNCISDGVIDKAFRAVAESVEEAIYNSMVAADRVVGFNGRETVTVRALNEFLPEAINRAKHG